MAMTLRLTEEESEALRTYAEAHGQSMQEIARAAIRDYVGDRAAKRKRLLQRIVTEDAEALDLLSK
jgi:hypothetical protein